MVGVVVAQPANTLSRAPPRHGGARGSATRSRRQPSEASSPAGTGVGADAHRLSAPREAAAGAAAVADAEACHPLLDGAATFSSVVSAPAAPPAGPPEGPCVSFSSLLFCFPSFPPHPQRRSLTAAASARLRSTRWGMRRRSRNRRRGGVGRVLLLVFDFMCFY